MDGIPWQIWLLGFSFFLLFSAFNPFQNYISILSENYASLSLTILYFVYACSCPFAPRFVEIFGAKNLLPVASLGYILFLLSPLIGPEWFLLIGGACLGLGASLLWTSQGTYFAEHTPPRLLGRASGIFGFFHQSSKLFGNAIASIIFTSQLAIRPELIFTLIGLCSFLSFLVLSRFSKSSTATRQSPKSLTKFLYFALSQEFRLYISLSFYAGFLRAYLVAQANPMFGAESIGFVNAVGGIVSMVSGLIFGKIFDSSEDKRWITKLSLAFAFGEIFLIHYIHNLSDESAPTFLFYVYSFLHNLAICAFDTSITALLSLAFSESKEDSFGAYYFFQSLSTSIFFAFARLKSFGILQALVLASTTLATAAIHSITISAKPSKPPSVELYDQVSYDDCGSSD